MCLLLMFIIQIPQLSFSSIPLSNPTIYKLFYVKYGSFYAFAAALQIYDLF